MNTSKVIKLGQYQPGPVVRIKGGKRVVAYHVPSRSSDSPRTVLRYVGTNRFECNCPADTGTCYHVSSVVVQEMREAGFSLVQVWTSEKDALRQHRKTYRITRNGKPAWFTVGQKGVNLNFVRSFKPLWGESGVHVTYLDGRREKLDLRHSALEDEARALGWEEGLPGHGNWLNPRRER
jgi:hypothetical protein